MRPLKLPIVLLVSFLFAICAAEKDSNAYPWGSNPNINKKMYWKDSPNVLEDLTKFSALYIKVHGCVWSEFGLGTSYDDDGENHDGDGNWYMSRVQPFRANAAFSLYGTLRDDVSFIGGCKKKTYINSFFTYLGADTIVSLLELGVSAFPDSSYGSNYCYEYEDENSGNNNKNRKDRRDLKSGDNNKNSDSMSTTMGCAEDGSFANAKFLGDDCDGKYFLNLTDSLNKYNAAMRKVSCYQVWNYRKEYTGSRALGQNYNDDQVNTTYGSIAEKLLLTSFSCDLELYPEACPNPYGLKAKYTSRMRSAAAASRKVTRRSSANATEGAWQKPLVYFSCFLLVIAMVLGLYAYGVKNRRYVEKEGGGVGGFTKVAWSDVRGKVVRGTAKALSFDGPDSRQSRTSKKTSKVQKKSSKKSKSGSQLSSKKEGHVEGNVVRGGATDFVIMPSERTQKKQSSTKPPDQNQKTGFIHSLRGQRNQSENDDHSNVRGAEDRYSPVKARQEKDDLWMA